MLSRSFAGYIKVRPRMVTVEQARNAVHQAYCGRPEWLPPEDELVVVDSATIERPWGWVFFYTSRKWLESSDARYALAGNAPVLVERATGKLIALGTARSAESYIATYEATGNPHA
jgi:Immunity protein 35